MGYRKINALTVGELRQLLADPDLSDHALVLTATDPTDVPGIGPVSVFVNIRSVVINTERQTIVLDRAVPEI